MKRSETLVERYGLSFGAGHDDRTSEEERRVRARLGLHDQSPFAKLDAHLMGALQCMVYGYDAIDTLGEPDPVCDSPVELRDKQMLHKARADFRSFQEQYGRLASAVWNHINTACARAPQVVELNAHLRSSPVLCFEVVANYQMPPTGPRPVNVLTTDPLLSGYSYTALVLANNTCVWMSHNEADHLLLLHGLYHFWRYAEKLIDKQMTLDSAQQRQESFYVMWQRWVGNSAVAYASATPFYKGILYLRRLLQAVLSILALADGSGGGGVANNKAK